MNKLQQKTDFAFNPTERELLEESVLLDCIQSREFNEDYFDVSLSGTTATLVI